MTFILFHIVVGLLDDGRCHAGLPKALPNDLHGKLGGMHHVGSIEAVVAQLVEDYLVGREVCDCLIA